MSVTFRFSIACTAIFTILMLCLTCNQQSDQQQLNQQPKMTPEHLRLSISQNWQKAANAGESNQIDSAIFWYQKIAEDFASVQQWDSLTLAISKAFRIAYISRDYEAFLLMLDSCNQLIVSAPDTIAAKIATAQGFAQNSTGNPSRALPYYKKSATIWEQYDHPKKIAGAYNMLGILYHKVEDYPLSEQYYRAGIPLNEQLRDTVGKRKTLYNLGRVLNAQGKWEEAISFLEQAQQLMPINDGAIENSITEAYLIGEQPDKALLYAEKAVQLVKNFEGRKRVSLYSANETLASVHLALNHTDQAIALYQQMLELLLEEYPPTHREVAKGYLFLGQSYQQKGLWNLALQAYQQSIQIFLPAFQPNDINDCPDSEDLLTREGYLMEALRYKGQVLQQKYESNGKSSDLEAADKHFETAVQFINQIRIYHTEAQAKTFYGRTYALPYTEEAIQTKLQLYEKTSAPVHQQKAFELAQQATAFLLRESVNEQQAMQIANVPSDTIAQLKKLNTSITEIQTTSAEQINTSKKDSLTNVLFQLKRKRLALLDAIEQNYPAYYELKHALAPILLKDVQKAIDPNTLVIKYFLGEKNLYTFAFSNRSIHSFATPINPSLFQHIRNYRQTLADLDYIREQPAVAEQQFIKSSTALYQQLLEAPLDTFKDEQLTKLAIVPDGLLNYLSFECMPMEPIDSWLEIDALLVSKYAVRYAYYTGLLILEDQEETHKSRFIGFGTEYDDATLNDLNFIEQDSVANPQLQDAFRGKELSKLLYADDEVDEVADLLSGTAFLNKSATKANFLHHAPGYDAVHVATHSFIDSENDSTAYIVFNQDDSNDYLLSLQEIYGLELDVDLITLSSCQTSLGALEESEGIMSLARAFKFAGSKSIIASQWSISDRSSFVIMKAFYENLHKGLSKDEALQKAKLAYLTDDQLSSPAYRIPAYWGAMVIVGDEQALVFEAVGTPWYYWVIGFLSILLIGVVLGQTHQNSNPQ